MVGPLAVLLTAVLFPHIIVFSTPKLLTMVFGAGIAWPMAVAISRGYERANIGVGGDELRAVMRAVVSPSRPELFRPRSVTGPASSPSV